MPTLDREHHLQEVAQQQGYVLLKRNDSESDFPPNGGFAVQHARTKQIVLGRAFDADLNDVEVFLR